MTGAWGMYTKEDEEGERCARDGAAVYCCVEHCANPAVRLVPLNLLCADNCRSCRGLPSSPSSPFPLAS